MPSRFEICKDELDLDYAEGLDLEDEYTRERLDKMYEDVKCWAKHVDFDIIELEEGLEVKLSNGGILHVDPLRVYVIGCSENKRDCSKGILVYSVDDTDETYTRIESSPLRRAIITLDEDFGSVQIGRHWLNDYVNITVYPEEVETFAGNWGEMTPQKRKELMDDIPESHHKEMLLNQLDAAGIFIPGWISRSTE